MGAVWLVGRIVYAWGYYQAAEKRTIGFGISSISGIVLLLGSLLGIILSLVRPRSLTIMDLASTPSSFRENLANALALRD